MPRYGLTLTNLSERNQSWNTPVWDVDIEAGGQRTAQPEEVNEDKNLPINVTSGDDFAGVMLRYRSHSDAWSLHPEGNPFVLHVDGEMVGIGCEDFGADGNEMPFGTAFQK